MSFLLIHWSICTSRSKGPDTSANVLSSSSFFLKIVPVAVLCTRLENRGKVRKTQSGMKLELVGAEAQDTELQLGLEAEWEAVRPRVGRLGPREAFGSPSVSRFVHFVLKVPRSSLRNLPLATSVKMYFF